MKLCIDTTSLLSAETGVGRYTRQIALAAARDPRFKVSFSPCDPCSAASSTKGLVESCKEVLKPFPLLYTTAKTAFRSLRELSARISPTHYDCYFEPNFVLGSVQAKTRIATVHDLSCFRHPEWHPQERVQYMQKNFSQSLARCHQIITVSKAVAIELSEMFAIPSCRITTIHNGVDHDLFYPRNTAECRKTCAELDLPEHFLLHVGTLEPRKNLASLLVAHAALPEALQIHYPLLLVGASGWKNSSLRERIGRSPHVRHIGYVNDHLLASLYNLATVMVYPSLYEGFGLPVLEAMACGCPVVTSNDPAILEITAQAALHVDAQDSDALRNQLEVLLRQKTLQQELHWAGITQAHSFSWQKSAQEHLDLFALQGASSCL